MQWQVVCWFLRHLNQIQTDRAEILVQRLCHLLVYRTCTVEIGGSVCVSDSSDPES